MVGLPNTSEQVSCHHLLRFSEPTLPAFLTNRIYKTPLSVCPVPFVALFGCWIYPSLKTSTSSCLRASRYNQEFSLSRTFQDLSKVMVLMQPSYIWLQLLFFFSTFHVSQQVNEEPQLDLRTADRNPSSTVFIQRNFHYRDQMLWWLRGLSVWKVDLNSERGCLCTNPSSALYLLLGSSFSVPSSLSVRCRVVPDSLSPYI